MLSSEVVSSATRLTKRPLFAAGQTVYLVADDALSITGVGPAAALLEATAHWDAWVGQPLADAVPELLGAEPLLQRVLAGDEPSYDLHHCNRLAEDGLRYVNISVMPFDGDCAGMPCLLALVQDVTEAARVEQQVTQQRNELQLAQAALAQRHAELTAAHERVSALLEERSAFFRMAAHDIKSPLFAITGFADLLLDNLPGPLTDEQRQFIELIRRRGHAIYQMVNDLLEVEQIEAGVTPLDRQMVDVGSLLADTLRVFMPQAEARHIALRWLEPGPLPLVATSSPALERIVSNLLSNAIKYSPEGTVVEVTATAADGLVCIRVADHGPGIPDAEKAHVFQRFYRSPRVRQSDIPGSGLGLSIVQALAARLGAQVALGDTPGGGATFQVIIPADDSLRQDS